MFDILTERIIQTAVHEFFRDRLELRLETRINSATTPIHYLFHDGKGKHFPMRLWISAHARFEQKQPSVWHLDESQQGKHLNTSKW